VFEGNLVIGSGCGQVFEGPGSDKVPFAMELTFGKGDRTEEKRPEASTHGDPIFLGFCAQFSSM
jgi:hypothetical protein